MCMAAAQVKLNLNPAGYVPNVTKEKDWGMLHGMDVNWQAKFILASLCFLLPFLSSSIAYRLSLCRPRYVSKHHPLNHSCIQF